MTVKNVTGIIERIGEGASDGAQGISFTTRSLINVVDDNGHDQIIGRIFVSDKLGSFLDVGERAKLHYVEFLAVGPIKKQKRAILVAIENKNNGRKTSDLFIYSEVIRGLKMTRNLLIGATIITIPFIVLLLPTLYCGWKTFQYFKLVSSIPSKNDMSSYLLREGFSSEDDIN